MKTYLVLRFRNLLGVWYFAYIFLPHVSMLYFSACKINCDWSERFFKTPWKEKKKKLLFLLPANANPTDHFANRGTPPQFQKCLAKIVKFLWNIFQENWNVRKHLFFLAIHVNVFLCMIFSSLGSYVTTGSKKSCNFLEKQSVYGNGWLKILTAASF